MQLYGLIGKTLGHSLSPRIHRRILEALGVAGDYALFEVAPQRLCALLPALETLSVRGANVTIPYKKDVIALLSAISPQAQAIGAVNTLYFEDGQWKGDNTDYFGLQRALAHHGIQLAGRRATILGAGGACEAVRALLADAGAREIVIVSRAAQKHGAHHGAQVVGYEALATRTADLLINATPVGMWPHVDASPVQEAVIARHGALVDLIYNPQQTLFMRMGMRMQKPVMNGLYMLVAQAVKAQEIWQGRPIDPAVTDAIYEELCQDV